MFQYSLLISGINDLESVPQTTLDVHAKTTCGSGNSSPIFTVSSETITSSFYTKPAAPLDDNTYILATDADMEFNADSVHNLLDLCNYDHRVGGACGRTHPIGKRIGPMVWYQMFEYAKGK